MELFPVTLEDKQKIYEIFKTNEQQVAKSVEIIKDWLKKQLHLPQKLPYDNFIEHFLLNNKFSVERTKQNIDKHFTLKTMNQYFIKILANEKLLKPSENSLFFYPLPKLGPNYERILIARLHNPNLELYNNEKLLYSTYTFAELAVRYSFSNGFILIFDFKYLTFEHFKKTDLNKFIKTAEIFVKGYTNRAAHIAVLNVPSFFNIIMAALKLVIKDKIINRISVHSDYNSLHKIVGPEYLPQEFGGRLGSLKQYLSTLDKVYKENHKFFMDSINYKTNEQLRIGKPDFDTFEEMSGTFRKLTVD